MMHDHLPRCLPVAPLAGRRGARARWRADAPDGTAPQAQVVASRQRRADHRVRHRAAHQADPGRRRRRRPARQEVIEELIDEKLKIQLREALHARGHRHRRRQRLSPTWRAACGMTAEQFAEQLGRAGHQPDTLKSRIRAESSGARSSAASSRAAPGQRQGHRAAQARKARTRPTRRLRLHAASDPFVVPRGSPPACVEGAQGGRSAARALPELRRGHYARRAGCATSRCASTVITQLRRPAAGSCARCWTRPRSAG